MRKRGMCLIDTSVFFETQLGSRFKNKKPREQCERFINKIGNVYDGMLSVSILGEYIMVAIEKKPHQINHLLELLGEWCHKLKLVSIDERTLKIFEKIKETDDRIEFMDALHLASAIRNKANYYVTLDKHSKQLEKEFKIKVRHPKDMA